MALLLYMLLPMALLNSFYASSLYDLHSFEHISYLCEPYDFWIMTCFICYRSNVWPTLIFFNVSSTVIAPDMQPTMLSMLGVLIMIAWKKEYM